MEKIQIYPKDGDLPLELLRMLGGYYNCPKTASGKRLGPLVGYAGKYGPKGAQKQYVGDVYLNFAAAERNGRVLAHFAHQLQVKLLHTDGHEGVTGFCGAPEGGKALAVALAIASGKEYLYPEKRVTAVATSEGREESALAFDRHQPKPGEVWWIVEDVCNNFSTTAKLVELIEGFGAKVAGIVCFLNRSLEVDAFFSPRRSLVLPVIALVRQRIPQYEQHDPEVEADIRAGNVVWKPKVEWHKLETAMEEAAQAA